MYHRITR